MEACLLITRTKKPEGKRGNVLIINAVKEVKQSQNIGFLEDNHQKRIYKAYQSYANEKGFCKVVGIEEILSNKASLNIARYVSNVDMNKERTLLEDAFSNWMNSSEQLSSSMDQLFKAHN